MKGVILAAGSGTRLAPVTLNIPKPLIPVLGRPLIEYTIGAFVEAGLTDLIIVVGYKEAMIREWVGDGSRYGARVEYALNLSYELRNAVSLQAAQQVLEDEPFVLTMADHMISPRILTTLLSSAHSENTLCVDQLAKAPPQMNDATRVWINEMGYIIRIGKDIKKWNAIDTGVFLFTSAIFSAISHLMREKENGPNLSHCVNWLIKQGYGVRACDVSGCFWMDVDTLEDLQYAENVLKEEAFKVSRRNKLMVWPNEGVEFPRPHPTVPNTAIFPYDKDLNNWEGTESNESSDSGN